VKLNIINKSKVDVPQAFLKKWTEALVMKLKKKGFPRVLKGKELILVFLDKKEAKKLNLQFRGMDYATDVLSFDPIDPQSLGELILCPQVLLKQAKEHKLSFELEIGYMVLHGVLHLLGFEHEESEEDAALMFKLQDEIFDAISIGYVNSSRTSRSKKTTRKS
jgi:probable rRNA maturation factor